MVKKGLLLLLVLVAIPLAYAAEQGCTIVDASWNEHASAIGSIATANLKAAGSCAGKQVAISIYENDLFFDDYEAELLGTFNKDNVAEIKWEVHDAGYNSLEGNFLEFYFMPAKKNLATGAFIGNEQIKSGLLIVGMAVASIDDGLVAHWAFDEGSGSTLHDGTGNGHDGTLMNGPVWVDGKRGGALQFDGADDYVGLGKIGHQFASQVTAAAWIKPNGQGSSYYVSIISWGNYLYPFNLVLTKGRNIRAGIRTSEKTYYVSTQQPLSFGNWHHVAMSYDGDALTVYVNGEPLASASAAGSLSQRYYNQTTIGMNPGNVDFFNGAIDELRVYDRALDAGEIAQLYSSTEPALDDDTSQEETPDEQPTDTPVHVPDDVSESPPESQPVMPLRLGIAATCAPNTYYVDFESGSDANDGTCTDRAWKYAPGDSNGPARTLNPGDTVLFKGGVHYYGSLAIPASGTAGNPITYKGDGWGTEKAILDGSRPNVSLTWTKCASAADCAGNPNWNNMYYASAPSGFTRVSPMFQDNEHLWIAQDPNLPEPIIFDDIAYYRDVPANNPAYTVSRTQITDPSYFTQSDPGYWTGSVAVIYSGANWVHLADITSFDPATDTIYFNNPYDPYNNGDGYYHYSIFGHISHIDRAGEYAVYNNKIYLWPNGNLDPNTRQISVTIESRRAVTLGSRNYINFEGFHITQYFSGRGPRIAGAAFWGSGSNVRIANNQIDNFKSFDEDVSGTIYLQTTTNDTVENNIISDIQNQRGIVFAGGSYAVVKRNTVNKLTNTGIYFQGVNHGQMIYNTVTNIEGIHGNGMTMYGGAGSDDNYNNLMAGNLVYDGNMAYTYHGHGFGLYVYNNIWIFY